MTRELTALAPLTRDLTEDLMKILTQPEYSFTATAEREIVPVVQEVLCHMRLDYDTELKSTPEFDKKKARSLPDGNIITVVPNLSYGAKVLFQPNFTGKQASGLHDTSFRTKCVVDISKECTPVSCRQVARPCCNGFFWSTMKELTALTPSTMKVKVVAPPE